jgi:hypothetical protein
MAVGRDHKLTSSGRITSGAVGHDRIQQAGAEGSIGEAIRQWNGLPAGYDFERIDVDVRVHKLGHFILAPLRAKLRGRQREIEIEKPVFPLSFNQRHQSSLWRKQIALRIRQEAGLLAWLKDEICRVVIDHEKRTPNILEPDVLRASGALSKLGLRLGPYVGKSYDCDPSYFQFPDLLPYECAVEVKKRSRDFEYQILRYKPLPRAVVLCIHHDLLNVPDDIDVIELAELCRHISGLLKAK